MFKFLVPTLSRSCRVASAFVAVFCVSSVVAGASVTKLTVDSKPTYNRVVLEFDEPVRYNATDSLRNRGFFYVDVYGLTVAYKQKLLTVNDSALRYIETVCYTDQGVLRLVFYAKSTDSSYQVNQIENPVRLVIDTVAAETGKLSDIRITDEDFAGKNGRTRTDHVDLSVAGQMRAAAGNGAVTLPQPHFRPTLSTPGGKKYVIIDPGHGGENTGARSSAAINGKQVLEKEICLQFAYHLKKLIDASPNMVALLTRTDDSNVSLQDRVQIAKEYKGDFFISLHLNDGDGNPAARGMEVYYLDNSGVASVAAKTVAERENREIGQTVKRSGQQPIVLDVLSDLDKYNLEKLQRESLDVCNKLHNAMITYPVFHTHTRGVKCAGFVVLKNSWMPAVLLEVGFITNSEELKYLVNPKFQQATAILIYNGLSDYFSEVDPGFRGQRLSIASVVADK